VNEVQDRNESFEERLLTELRAVVEERAAMPAGEGVERNRSNEAERLHGGARDGATVRVGGAHAGLGGRRLAPRLVFGGAAVAAVAAGVLAVSSGTGDTSSAFAVEPQGDGTVRVEISSLSDAAGLEKALEEAGVKADVNYLAAGMVCREPRFTPTAAAKEQQGETSGSIRKTDSGVVFTITRAGIGSDDTLLVTASPGPEGMGDMVGVAIAEGAVSPCDPVPAPEGMPPGASTQSRGAPGAVPPGAAGEPHTTGPQEGFSESGPHSTGPQQGFSRKGE
jgi:hypothetical protein